MKKTFKIIGISLASLLALVVIVIAVVCWLVLTPARLTPIVNKVADKVLNCESEVGRANLSVIRTFPHAGLAIDDVLIVNPKEGAANDTVASLGHCDVAVDVKAFLKEKKIVVKGLKLSDGDVYLFTAADGTSNLDFLPASNDTIDTDTTSFDFSSLDLRLRDIAIRRLSATYDNRRDTLLAAVSDLNLDLEGTYADDDLDAKLKTSLASLLFDMNTSSPIKASLQGLTLDADAAALVSTLQGKGAVALAIDSLQGSMGEMQAGLKGFGIHVDAQHEDTTWIADLKLDSDPIAFFMDGEKPLDAATDGLHFALDGRMDGRSLQAKPVLSVPGIAVKLGRMKLLRDADVNLELPALTDTMLSFLTVDDGFVALNKFRIAINGDIFKSDSDEGLHIHTDRWNVNELLALVPAEYRSMLEGIELKKGDVQLDATVKGGLRDLEHLKAADATVLLTDADVTYNDSIHVVTPKLSVTAQLPAKHGTTAFKEWASGTIASPSLAVNMIGTMDADVQSLDGTFSLSDITDSRKPLSAQAKLAMGTLDAVLDTIKAHADAPQISALLTTDNGRKNGKPHYKADVRMKGLTAQVGQAIAARTGQMAIAADAVYDASKEQILDQWNPTLNVNLQQGHGELDLLPVAIDIPHIQFDFTPGLFHIDDSRFLVGNSDFSLKGDVSNLSEYLAGNGLIKGNLDFTSTFTDVTEILDIVSGLGASDSTATATAEVEETTVSADDDPFMVPLGVDVFLRTNIQTARWNGFDFHNLGGKVTCRDGVLVLEEIGFTSDAATMQLTAMYKSPRKNHLFVGADFHLMDIEIDDLISLIPDVDSIVPMLKSFDGQAQFHFAAETYLKSNYDIKLSTLRAAGAIEGKDLVVLPSSTFDTIKKYLMTDKSTENRIDSLDVELSVYRDKVDLYPFRVRLGQYEAIVGGRHNINQDFDFNYHISLTDCPLPARLGLDVSGTLDDMHFKLAPCKYSNLYKPEKRGEVQTRTLELKTAINEALKRNVKSEEHFRE